MIKFKKHTAKQYKENQKEKNDFDGYLGPLPFRNSSPNKFLLYNYKRNTKNVYCKVVELPAPSTSEEDSQALSAQSTSKEASQALPAQSTSKEASQALPAPTKLPLPRLEDPVRLSEDPVQLNKSLSAGGGRNIYYKRKRRKSKRHKKSKKRKPKKRRPTKRKRAGKLSRKQ